MASNENAGVDKLLSFGKMALEQGWYDQARDYFKQALALDASNREAMKGLARANEILSRRDATAAEPIQVEQVKQPPKVVSKRRIPEKEMKDLAERGLVIRVGHTRGTRYVLPSSE